MRYKCDEEERKEANREASTAGRRWSRPLAPWGLLLPPLPHTLTTWTDSVRHVSAEREPPQVVSEGAEQDPSTHRGQHYQSTEKCSRQQATGTWPVAHTASPAPLTPTGSSL